MQDSFEKNFKVIVCLDANEYFKDEKLAKRLEEISLIETSHLFSNKNLEPSHINRSQQIDSIWTSPTLIPQSLSTIPYYFGVGDHKYFIVNFPYELILVKGYI